MILQRWHHMGHDSIWLSKSLILVSQFMLSCFTILLFFFETFFGEHITKINIKTFSLLVPYSFILSDFNMNVLYMLNSEPSALEK
jgi:hypothetical protein